ncbi:hypothetical protein GCM10010833_33440 [Blastomonas aquatica]|uniref:Sulphotransferase Stf0 domain-containing protein n=2 Tax=Blastomonas aquatica TaxID=1510276 RepID=A0ABQ1JVE4_9SPHN|nr:hypothetical protein GCM10010833_33440 [Blastomonas aquatica]
MDQHQDVFWDGETQEKKLHQIEKKSEYGFADLYGAFDLDEGIRELQNRMKRRASGRIFGTEMQDYHAEIMKTDIEEYITRLRHLGFDRFIFLERNYLRKLVSHLIATQRQKFHIQSKEHVAAHKIRINPARIYVGHRHTTLLDAFYQYRDFFAKAHDAVENCKILRLSYEQDIQRNPVVAAQRTCQFLEIDEHLPQINFGKTTDSPLSEIVDNYEEVIECVLKSEFSQEAQDLLRNE